MPPSSTGLRFRRACCTPFSAIMWIITPEVATARLSGTARSMLGVFCSGEAGGDHRGGERLRRHGGAGGLDRGGALGRREP